MLESQFYLRLVFTALFGVLFIYAMINLAKSNPISDTKGKHIVRKIVGSFLLLIGVISGIGSIIYICNITFPAEMLGQPFTANMIVRKVGVVQHWGYPTPEQQISISLLTSLFVFLAFAGYCFCFRKSHSNWWKRILKVILIILTYMFYVSSTDWHYFDTPEFAATILYAVCIGVIFKISKEKKENEVTNAESEQSLTNNVEELSCVAEDTFVDSNISTQQINEELSKEYEVQSIEAKESSTRKISFEPVKSFIINSISFLGNFFKNTFGAIKFRIIGIIIGLLVLATGGVFLYVSVKTYPDYIETFGDKWKHTFNISNDAIAKKLISKAYSERYSGEFLILDYEGLVAICDSSYFYSSLEEFEEMHSHIKTLSKPIETKNSNNLMPEYIRLNTCGDGYCSIRCYNKNDKDKLYKLFKEQEIWLESYSIDEYKKRFEVWFNKASEVYTNNVETTKEIASHYYDDNNLNRAENTYKFALSHNKDNPELLGLLSYIQFKNNNIEEAEISARNAIKHNRTETNAATTLSMIYAYKSDWTQTVKWSKLAIDYGSELPDAYYMYSAGSYNIGDKKVAMDYYNKAHNLDSENYYAEKYEECGGCPLECIKLEHGFTKEGGEVVTDYGQKLLSSKSRYLATRMEANAYRTGRYSFDIKVYENGILSTGDTRVEEGYSYNTTVNIHEIGKCTLQLDGWGSNTPGTWGPGRYRVEVWYKGELVDDNIFRIE